MENVCTLPLYTKKVGRKGRQDKALKYLEQSGFFKGSGRDHLPRNCPEGQKTKGG